MNITTSQYRQGKKGSFLSTTKPEPGESLVLVMPTGRGKRRIPVGHVIGVQAIGAAMNMVHVTRLEFVKGMDY